MWRHAYSNLTGCVLFQISGAMQGFESPKSHAWHAVMYNTLFGVHFEDHMSKRHELNHIHQSQNHPLMSVCVIVGAKQPFTVNVLSSYQCHS
jgi:hypothetical protein